MCKWFVLPLRVVIFLAGISGIIASMTSMLWGLAFVTARSFGLEVVSWFWVFAGPVVVVFAAFALAIIGYVLVYLSRELSP
ncbi:hypothetical protein [Halomonas sp. BMC6]|uniref:hypothetical protein n=1 Tax=Halomonas sp. BMC6 TaxID=3073244 RepID=UPI0030CD8481